MAAEGLEAVTQERNAAEPAVLLGQVAAEPGAPAGSHDQGDAPGHHLFLRSPEISRHPINPAS
jgi:hypothetical protein